MTRWDATTELQLCVTASESTQEQDAFPFADLSSTEPAGRSPEAAKSSLYNYQLKLKLCVFRRN